MFRKTSGAHERHPGSAMIEQQDAENQRAFTDMPMASLLGPIPFPEEHPDYKPWAKAVRLAEEEFAVFDAEYVAKRPKVALLESWALDYIPGKFEIQAKWLARLYAWSYELADALRPALEWYSDQWLMVAITKCPSLAQHAGFKAEMRSRLLSVITKNRPIALAYARESEDKRERDLEREISVNGENKAARSVANCPLEGAGKTRIDAVSIEGRSSGCNVLNPVLTDLLPDLQQSVKAALVFERKALLDEYRQVVRVPNKKIYEARNSNIHKPQFYAWIRGELSAASQTSINFERFLREKKPPLPRS